MHPTVYTLILVREPKTVVRASIIGKACSSSDVSGHEYPCGSAGALHRSLDLMDLRPPSIQSHSTQTANPHVARTVTGTMSTSKQRSDTPLGYIFSKRGKWSPLLIVTFRGV